MGQPEHPRGHNAQTHRLPMCSFDSADTDARAPRRTTRGGVAPTSYSPHPVPLLDSDIGAAAPTILSARGQHCQTLDTPPGRAELPDSVRRSARAGALTRWFVSRGSRSCEAAPNPGAPSASGEIQSAFRSKCRTWRMPPHQHRRAHYRLPSVDALITASRASARSLPPPERRR